MTYGRRRKFYSAFMCAMQLVRMRRKREWSSTPTYTEVLEEKCTEPCQYFGNMTCCQRCYQEVYLMGAWQMQAQLGIAHWNVSRSDHLR